jgi:hypothetical protein
MEFRLYPNTVPLGYEGGDTNLNRYVRNNPTNATDPLGLCQQDNLNQAGLDKALAYLRQFQKFKDMEAEAQRRAKEKGATFDIRLLPPDYPGLVNDGFWKWDEEKKQSWVGISPKIKNVDLIFTILFETRRAAGMGDETPFRDKAQNGQINSMEDFAKEMEWIGFNYRLDVEAMLSEFSDPSKCPKDWQGGDKKWTHYSPKDKDPRNKVTRDNGTNAAWNSYWKDVNKIDNRVSGQFEDNKNYEFDISHADVFRMWYNHYKGIPHDKGLPGMPGRNPKPVKPGNP